MPKLTLLHTTKEFKQKRANLQAQFSEAQQSISKQGTIPSPTNSSYQVLVKEFEQIKANTPPELFQEELVNYEHNLMIKSAMQDLSTLAKQENYFETSIVFLNFLAIRRHLEPEFYQSAKYFGDYWIHLVLIFRILTRTLRVFQLSDEKYQQLMKVCQNLKLLIDEGEQELKKLTKQAIKKQQTSVKNANKLQSVLKKSAHTKKKSNKVSNRKKLTQPYIETKDLSESEHLIKDLYRCHQLAIEAYINYAHTIITDSKEAQAAFNKALALKGYLFEKNQQLLSQIPSPPTTNKNLCEQLTIDTNLIRIGSLNLEINLFQEFPHGENLKQIDVTEENLPNDLKNIFQAINRELNFYLKQLEIRTDIFSTSEDPQRETLPDDITKLCNALFKASINGFDTVNEINTWLQTTKKLITELKYYANAIELNNNLNSIEKIYGLWGNFIHNKIPTASAANASIKAIFEKIPDTASKIGDRNQFQINIANDTYLEIQRYLLDQKLSKTSLKKSKKKKSIEAKENSFPLINETLSDENFANKQAPLNMEEEDNENGDDFKELTRAIPLLATDECCHIIAANIALSEELLTVYNKLTNLYPTFFIGSLARNALSLYLYPELEVTSYQKITLLTACPMKELHTILRQGKVNLIQPNLYQLGNINIISKQAPTLNIALSDVLLSLDTFACTPTHIYDPFNFSYSLVSKNLHILNSAEWAFSQNPANILRVIYCAQAFKKEISSDVTEIMQFHAPKLATVPWDIIETHLRMLLINKPEQATKNLAFLIQHNLIHFVFFAHSEVQENAPPSLAKENVLKYCQQQLRAYNLQAIKPSIEQILGLLLFQFEFEALRHQSDDAIEALAYCKKMLQKRLFTPTSAKVDIRNGLEKIATIVKIVTTHHHTYLEQQEQLEKIATPILPQFSCYQTPTVEPTMQIENFVKKSLKLGNFTN